MQQTILPYSYRKLYVQFFISVYSKANPNYLCSKWHFFVVLYFLFVSCTEWYISNLKHTKYNVLSIIQKVHNVLRSIKCFLVKIVIDFMYLCSRWTNDLPVYGWPLSHVSTFIFIRTCSYVTVKLYRFIYMLSKVFLVYFTSSFFASFSVEFPTE